MKRVLSLMTAVFLAVVISVSISPAFNVNTDAPVAAPNPVLLPLTPLKDFGEWFEQQTGYLPDPTYFGVYAFLPLSDTLYIGFGTGRPAEYDGSLLAWSDGLTVTAVATLTEQGFIGMTSMSGTVYIPGVDPCCSDGWEFGNTYAYTPTQSLIKYRNLPDVVHSWGLWADERKETLYTAVSFSPAGGDGGGVFSSTTKAQSWQLAADLNSGVGLDRTYDIIGVHDKLYVTWSDVYEEPCGLAVSDDDGQTWSRFPGLATACRSRLTVFQNKLLALSADRGTLYGIDAYGSVTGYPLPGFLVPEWTYNYLAADGAGNLYTISEDGRLKRTADLVTWDTVVYTDLDLITIAYWPEKNWLVLSDRGSGARLWRFDLNPPPPAKYVILMIADGWGANHIAAANAYSGEPPPYQAWNQTWMSTYPASGSYDPALTWSSFSHALSGVTDSAAAATAMYSGVKTANGRIAVDVAAAQRLYTISEKVRGVGMGTGAVSTVFLSHATPGVWMGHNDARSNGYAIADEGLWGDPNSTGTTADSPWYGGGHGPTRPPLDVLIGAGHPDWNGGNYVNSAIRDQLATDDGQVGDFAFVERLAGSPNGGARLMAVAQVTTTTRLAGLFGGSSGNLEYRLADGSGHDPENPTLAQMTSAALTVLNRVDRGFVLMVEGGAVDWASHTNQMDRMIGELIGFNQAVQAVVDWVEAPANGSSWDNTLVIITGDHETGYLTTAPGVFPDQPLGAINEVTLELEKTIAGTGRRASWEDVDGDDAIDAGETIYWAWNSGGHSNSLIPIYAHGAGADLLAAFAYGTDPVRGDYVDNTAVFYLMDTVLQRNDRYLPIVLRD